VPPVGSPSHNGGQMSASEVHRGNTAETSPSLAVAGQMRALRIAFGVGTVALGIVALFWPQVTLTAVAILFGIQLIVAGALRIATAVTSKAVEGWLRAVLFLVGILVLLAGVLCLRNPFVSLLGVAVLISFGWMVNGIMELLAATSPEVPGARWLHVLLGIVSIVGALVVLFWPGLALLTFNIIGGWLLIIFGAMSAWSALREPRTATSPTPMRAGGSTAATA
jgi:uncharacterized membrane protein HdeD (DUF308 family)